MHRAGWMVLSGVLAASLAAATPAQAQGFGSLSKLKKKAVEAKKAGDTAASKKKGNEEAKPESTKGEEPSQKAEAAKPQARPADAGGQPNLTAVKIDFVPGERTVFYDDFSDMAPDEPPPHWKVRGGTVALKLGQDIHELMPGGGVAMTSGKIAVPKDFTFEIVCDCHGEIDWKLQNVRNDSVLAGSFQENPDQTRVTTRVEAKEGLGDGEVKVEPGKLLTFALWAQQGRVRVYLNGERVVDANQVDFSGIDHILLEPSRYRPTGIRSVRVAESAPDVSTTLAASGKYVSHGINFDTDSDRLKPDSAPVIKAIAGALIKNPAMKLAITGYTDSTGVADHNVDLSKRRAEAVRGVLVSQFGIDAARLTAAGRGAADPIASNDTADGRAQNRRVEFVKQ